MLKYTMSWVLFMCATLAVLAEGTLGGKALGFPKTRHRVSMLDRVIGERYRVNIGGAHELSRKDENTCTPDSEEYDRRRNALLCNEEYLRAVREEIEKSNCSNRFYSPDTKDEYDYDDEDPNPCPIIDERVNVGLCSEECSLKQSFFLLCNYLGEESVEINRECGVSGGEADCSFNDKNFCVSEVIYPSSNFQTVYNECFLESNVVNDGSCSDKCKNALDDFTDANGCCVGLYFDIPFSVIFELDTDGDEALSANLFSTCEVEIPNVCNILNFSPPEEFLDCAHDGDVNNKGGGDVLIPTVFSNIALMIVSSFAKL